MSKKKFKALFWALVWILSVFGLIYSGGTMLYVGDYVQGAVMLIIAAVLITAGFLDSENTIFKRK